MLLGLFTQAYAADLRRCGVEQSGEPVGGDHPAPGATKRGRSATGSWRLASNRSGARRVCCP